MKWLPDGPCAIKRDDGHFIIMRAPQPGFVPEGGRITFLLVDHFKHEVIGGVRNVPDDPERIRKATESLKERAGHA